MSRSKVTVEIVVGYVYLTISAITKEYLLLLKLLLKHHYVADQFLIRESYCDRITKKVFDCVVKCEYVLTKLRNSICVFGVVHFSK